MFYRIDLPYTGQVEHLENVLSEIKKNYSQGNINGFEYELLDEDPLESENEILKERNQYLTDRLESIKQELTFKNTSKEKIKCLENIIEETEF